MSCGWLGGGLIVLATGLWAAFVYFFPPGKSPEAKSPELTPPSVQANCGGIAIGRDVSGSTVTAAPRLIRIARRNRNEAARHEEAPVLRRSIECRTRRPQKSRPE